MEALRERFGKYHVLEKIAQGGMAEVYKVKTIGIAGFEKVQALKRILPHSAREGRFIRSFIDEARIAVELTHRNIVQVFDFGKADGELFLAMELIEGKDLRTALGHGVARELLPPIAVGAYVVSEVAAGLDYAHRRTDGYGGSLGIVHCDVSPSNVMLSADGYVKILDFGIARATFATALERRRLRGKPRYMAPEQTLGDAPTAAADVFALGIIAWELFTGLPLYTGPDLRSILEAVRRTVPARIDAVNPDVPPEIADAVARALAREPLERGTAADLGAACARAALGAGARALAGWLAALDQRASQQVLDGAQPRQADATPPSVPGRSGPTPSTRPSARSETASLASAAPPGTDLGAGTPGFARATRSASRISVAPLGGELTGSLTGSWADIGVEGSTLAGGRLGEAYPDPVAPEPGDTDPAATARFSRPSYEALQLGPLLRPSGLGPDDAGTHHGMGDREDTGYDELEVEAGGERPDEAVDEAIDDDDLGDRGPVHAGFGERRRTVLVVGVLTGARPDAVRQVTRSLGELAYQRGGVVLELDEDALVIAFGLEVAGEDDLAVAMGWALDAGAMARDAGGDIVLRVGARAGIVTGDAGHGGPRIPQPAIEEARLVAYAASPAHPRFVGGAGRLTSSLYALREVADLPPSDARAIEVVGPRSFDERDRARLDRRGKLIGRGAQLTELEAWLHRAIAADRRLAILITGAAGTGKSRLAAELIARRTAAGTPIRVITAAASPANQLAPFALVIELYQAALGLPAARGRAARAQVVERLLHVLAQAGVRDERARAVAIDLDRAMELRDGLGVGARELADLRPRISAGLAAFRAAVADRARPLVTLIEDLHQADSASLEVLRHTLAVPEAAPELLILTSRPGGGVAPPVDAVIEVGDLVGAELRALVSDRLGDLATPFNIAAVLARAGGNPLFVEELAQAVRELGGTGDEVPASARAVVAARLERLSPRAQIALRWAAVLGPTLRVRLLEELLDQESLQRELDELVAGGCLVRPAHATGSSEGELQFARGLVRDVVYEALAAPERRASHARVGRLLASRFFAGREEPPAVIADHLERGGDAAGAAAFWLRAGRLALAAWDATGAVRCFTRTLALEHALGDPPPTPTSRARRRAALAGREEAHRLSGDLASDPGDLDALQQLCGREPARLADVAIRRAQRLLRQGEHAAATIASVVAEDHALAAADDRLRGEALRVRGEILERLGRFDEALAVVGAARELFHRQRAIGEEMGAMIARGRLLLLRAQYEAAHDAYRPVVTLIEQTGDPWLERIVTNHVAVIEKCLGNFTQAMASVERSLALCRRYGDRAREGDGLAVAGMILLEVGLHDDAAPTLARALAMLAQTASPWGRADCLVHAGVCDVERGHPGGLALLGEAVVEARRLGARYLEAGALVARAGAQLRAGAPGFAIADAAAGTAVAHEAGFIGHEIQGLARHALALTRSSRAGHAAAALVTRALELLDHQRHLDGSEEEVLVACAEVLRGAGDHPTADAIMDRGRTSARRKLDALADPAWRAAFAARSEIRALLEA